MRGTSCHSRVEKTAEEGWTKASEMDTRPPTAQTVQNTLLTLPQPFMLTSLSRSLSYLSCLLLLLAQRDEESGVPAPRASKRKIKDWSRSKAAACARG